jgi:hypothetical protein
MTPEGPGLGKFAEFMTDHLIIDQDRYVLLAVMHSNGQSNHFRQNHGAPRPGLDWPLVIRLN